MRYKCALLLVLIVVCGLTASLFAQGLTTTQTKDEWEEINFVFNSAILTDGYPSLLRLADLLKQNPDYRVRLEGHADHIGPDAYNQRLGMRRAADSELFYVAAPDSDSTGH